MTNDNFAKLVDDDNTFMLEFAPLLSGDDVTDQDYYDLGYRKLEVNPPDVDKDLFTVVQTGYQEVEDNILSAAYSIIEKKIVLHISKYKLIVELTRRGIWAQCKQMIEQSGLYDLFLAAQEFNTEDTFFNQGLELAKAQLGVSDEDIREVLEASLA